MIKLIIYLFVSIFIYFKGGTMAHNHYVYDNDAHFIVHPFTRTIRKAKSKTHTVIQNDHHH